MRNNSKTKDVVEIIIYIYKTTKPFQSLICQIKM